MMKYLKIFAIFLLVVIAVTSITSMVLPAKQRVERVIIINVPVSAAYQQLIKLENFNRWAVWNQQDSSIKNTLAGTDGTVGASSSWAGHPEISGEGKIVIASLRPNRKIVHDLTFIKPAKGAAQSELILEEINAGTTKLTWEFDLTTPRPWNILNLFSSMDKKMGKDFEKGLDNMKAAIEKMTTTMHAKAYDVKTINFPASAFATIRQQIKWSDMVSFYAQQLPKVYEEVQKVNAAPGIPSGLFYEWDEKSQLTDLAVAIPVPIGTKMENNTIQVVNIPASKAVFVDYSGAYDKIQEAYNSIRKYLADNNLKEKTPAIEQYITDPAKEKDTTKWKTKIVFLVE